MRACCWLAAFAEVTRLAGRDWGLSSAGWWAASFNARVSEMPACDETRNTGRRHLRVVPGSDVWTGPLEMVLLERKKVF